MLYNQSWWSVPQEPVFRHDSNLRIKTLHPFNLCAEFKSSSISPSVYNFSLPYLSCRFTLYNPIGTPQGSTLVSLWLQFISISLSKLFDYLKMNVRDEVLKVDLCGKDSCCSEVRHHAAAELMEQGGQGNGLWRESCRCKSQLEMSQGLPSGVLLGKAVKLRWRSFSSLFGNSVAFVSIPEVTLFIRWSHRCCFCALLPTAFVIHSTPGICWFTIPWVLSWTRLHRCPCGETSRLQQRF